MCSVATLSPTQSAVTVIELSISQTRSLFLDLDLVDI